MLYRAQDRNGTSRLGYATSVDGIHFIRRPEPVMSPETDYERDGGIEDPRLVDIDGTYYLTYTGYNKKDAQLCLATSNDLVHWDRKGVILPAYQGRWNVGWTKSGAIVPEEDRRKILDVLPRDRGRQDRPDGPRPTRSTFCTGLMRSTDQCYRNGRADSTRGWSSPAPPPIVTADAIILVYNGADAALRVPDGCGSLRPQGSAPGAFADGHASSSRLKLTWEKVGQVPNVVFVEGMVLQRQPMAVLLRWRR